MPNSTFKKWLDQNRQTIDAVVFDIDGVLVKGRTPIPGAADMIRFLHNQDIPFALLTNDGCHSPEEKASHLAEGGIPVNAEELVSCSHGISELVNQYNWHGQRFFVMGSLGTPCFAQLAGLDVTRNPRELDSCTGIIVGEKDYNWYGHITAAFNALMQRPDIPLIVPNPDEYFPSKPGRLGIGSGAVGRFLQHLCQQAGTHINPVYLGKPYEPIFLYNHHRFEKRLNKTLPHDRVIMIGDSLKSDIPGSLNFGYQAALVMTGITTPDILKSSDTQPDIIFSSLT